MEDDYKEREWGMDQSTGIEEKKQSRRLIQKFGWLIKGLTKGESLSNWLDKIQHNEAEILEGKSM